MRLSWVAHTPIIPLGRVHRLKLIQPVSRYVSQISLKLFTLDLLSNTLGVTVTLGWVRLIISLLLAVHPTRYSF